MTEIETRAALRDLDGTGGVEHWIAGQLWQVEPIGYAIPTALLVAAAAIAY